MIARGAGHGPVIVRGAGHGHMIVRGAGGGARGARIIATAALLLSSFVAPRLSRAEPPAPADSSALFSADAIAEGEVVVAAAGGLALLIPAVSLDLGVGVARDVDIAVHYDGYLGLVHSFGYAMKAQLVARPALSIAARAELAYAFWATETVLDLRAEDLPFGNGLAVNVGARASITVRDRVRLSFDASLTVGVLAVTQVAHRVRELEPDGQLRTVNLGVAAHWRRPDGQGFFVRVTGVVPTRGLFIVGFAPLVELGWSFPL